MLWCRPARTRRRGAPSLGGLLLILAGLLTVGFIGLGRQLARFRMARFRMAGAVMGAGAVFLATGVSVVRCGAAAGGVHVPGQNTLQRLINRWPLPWKAARPAYVAPPEASALEMPAMLGATPLGATPGPGRAHPARVWRHETMPDHRFRAPAMRPPAATPFSDLR